MSSSSSSSRAQINGANCCNCPWFEPKIIASGTPEAPQYFVNISPGIVYKSLNPKDFMVWSGYIDQQTMQTLESENLKDDFIIYGLMENKALNKDDIIYLQVDIRGLATYPSKAEIIVTGNYWSGYPEPFIFKNFPTIDNQGQITSQPGKIFQTAAIFPIAYLTSDTTQNGDAIDFGTPEQSIPRVLVRTLCKNILLHKFNYDGIGVTYGVKAPIQTPFLNFVQTGAAS